MTQENEAKYKPLILVVDDNSEFLNGIRLTLEMEGFRVITAGNGQEALSRLTGLPIGQSQVNPELKRLPDLILADIMMPQMDGYEFYERVRAHPYTNRIPFIFLTAKSGDEDTRYGTELGAEDYFSKLDSPENLLASIRGKLNRQEQQRAVMGEFYDETGQAGGSGGLILLIVIAVLIVLAFYIGTLFS